MKRAEDLIHSNECFSCRICTGHGIYTICKFGSLRSRLMSILIALSLLSSSVRSFPLNLRSYMVYHNTRALVSSSAQLVATCVGSVSHDKSA
jgi:hypothetical protein